MAFVDDDDRAHLLALRDPAIPALPELLGEGAREILAVALPGAVEIAEAVPAQVTLRPGRSVTVRYDVKVTTPGSEETVMVVAAAGDSGPGGGVMVGRDAERVTLFAVPHDPALPGLATAMDPARARTLLDAVAAPPGPVTTAIRAYRPCRRAVVELRTGTARVFVKVVRPAAIASLQEKHRCLAGVVPVPRSHGWSRDLGLVVLEARSGLTLREALTTGDALPDASALATLLDRLPAPPFGASAATPLSMLRTHADLVACVVPSLAPAVSALTGAIAASPGPASPPVPVHGDFHAAQVLVSGGDVSGLLDVDTFAFGDRIDDWATMIGHLLTWAADAPATVRVHEYARHLLDAGDRKTGCPRGLRLRIAAVILGLATGPFRVQMPGWVAETRRRVDLAQAWVDHAAAPGIDRENTLTALSTSSHARGRA